MGFTSKQWFQIVSGINGGLITGAALLQTLFGQDLTIKIVAGLGVFGIILNSIGTVVSGQANLVRDVAAMPGVEKITVNTNASQALAQVAVDPAQTKVGPIPGTREQVDAVAKGNA